MTCGRTTPRSRDQRNNPIRAKFGRLLNDPIHVITFEERLREQNPGTCLIGTTHAILNMRSQLGGRHLGDLGMIAIALFIGQPNGLTDLHAKACAEMMTQVSGDRDTVAMYGG